MSPDTPPKAADHSGLLVILVLFAVVAAGGSVILYSLSRWSAPEKARNMPNPVPATRQSVAAGMSTYGEHCAKCHGQRGDGKGEKAGELSIAPTDFSDARLMNATTDGELFWKISRGHRPMPAFHEKLSEEQRWQLVDYIRTFVKPPPNRP
jgi:mono/diheme cytochrome c family protein